MTPKQLASQLATALGDRLHSVVVYGSAAAGDFVPGVSTYNVLVLAQPLTVTELELISGAMAAWHKAGHPTPLMFTPAQLMASTDAFPIELLDIRQSRQVLHGPDLLAELRVEPGHLRLQVERELTGKLLALRGQYLLAAGRPAQVEQLMLHSASTFLVLFRAALRLFQESVPAVKLEALRALSQHITFDTAPFEKLLELKQQAKAERRATSGVTFASYLAAIESVANAINLPTPGPRSDA